MAVPTGSLDFDLVIFFGTVLGTALLARWTQLPITALEIVAGIALVAVFGIALPTGADSLLVFGSLLIVFLAGLETNLDFLRTHFRRAITIGLGGFLVPFVGLFALLYGVVHAPLLVSLVGATALADTSISIVYTTLKQFDLTDLPFGRLILASTLAVNLVEDASITTTTLLTSTALLFTLGVIGALALTAVFLPRLTKALAGEGLGGFSNVTARSVLFSLAVLAGLSSLVGVPGILFVFLMGLMFSRFANDRLVVGVRQIAFAVFVPLYFLAVGLQVDFSAVTVSLPLLLGVVAVASVLKVVSILVVARRPFGPEKVRPVAVLMNTRLTSATVILTLTLALGMISRAWYSLFIAAVVTLAIGSVLVLRTFPAFRSTEAARSFFAGSIEAGPSVGAPVVPAPVNSP